MSFQRSTSNEGQDIKTERQATPWFLWLSVIAGCSVVSIALLSLHPLVGLWLVAIYAATAMFCYVKPFYALATVLAVFPWFSFAPWTGWLVVEEFDILVLVFAAAVCLRQFLQPLHVFPCPDRADYRFNSKGVLLLLAFFMIGGYSFWYGLTQAGDFSWRFFTNYQTAENALRTGKSLLLALVFVVAWYALARSDKHKLYLALVYGMSIGLAFAVFGCIYERYIFTGLSNMSTDYRTTAWFWEMHLGGAALDGYLAVTIPFALALWPITKAHWARGLLILFYTLILYAVITTFSRAVYAAVPLAVCVMLAAMQHQTQVMAWRSIKVRVLVAFTVLAAVGTFYVFPEGGYRASLAYVAVIILIYWSWPFLSGITYRSWFSSMVLGLALLWPLLSFAAIDKLPYIAFFLSSSFAFMLLFWAYFREKPKHFSVVLLLIVITLNFIPSISFYWNKSHEYGQSLAMSIVLYAVFTLFYLLCKKVHLFKVQLNVVEVGAGSALLLITTLVFAMFMSSSYIDQRFSSVDRDLFGRFDHWQQASDIQQKMGGLWTGSGTGRFVNATYWHGPEKERISSFQLVQDKGDNVLFMHTGNHMHGYGEVLRITQQVFTPAGRPTLTFRAKSTKDTSLSAELCEKQLLYHGSCISGSTKIDVDTDWKNYQIKLNRGDLHTSDWGQVRHLMFMLYVGKPDTKILLDDVQLVDEHGRSMIKNGQFSQDMAFWFFTSDRNHMPYHLKNLLMHVFFEQGVIGLAVTLLLTGYVLARTLFGRSQQHPLAPAIAASIAGLMVIGFFDSVVDGARMAWVFQTLLFLGASLNLTRLKTQ
ncbi:hypothetical protein [Rheinheimera sp. 4Y26]|uniref:hypothetical protein n=1 Tax=Rheinheimera sp. 4Y26 TaxID=2977811 RepID=UPI0021B1482C|nr:hypothetical protein [Rheinheimera sp. 4Y26]MCT6699045.1 hypothetical protein [Rheinheimera sp. 4Y26]